MGRVQGTGGRGRPFFRSVRDALRTPREPHAPPRGAMAAGDTVEVELRPARGGSGSVRLPVVTHESVGG